jgi:secondary thiamine-phosphate synthase enzyme
VAPSKAERRRIPVRTTRREELVDITSSVKDVVANAGIQDGVVHLWSLHTTCALTVNEGADPDVARDLVGAMNELVPQSPHFKHDEGNSDSHIKTSLFGPGLTLLIEGGELVLGTWQHVFLAEWDGPRQRQVAYIVTPS